MLRVDFSDAAFIASLRSWDEGAWNTFYTEVSPKLKNFIRKMLLPAKPYIDIEEKASDLVADTFERALTSIETFNPLYSNVRTWIFNIAHNLITDF